MKEIEKSNTGRLWSVFVVSPYLFYLATKNQLSGTQRGILFLLGLGTVISVGYAWTENKKRLDAAREKSES